MDIANNKKWSPEEIWPLPSANWPDAVEELIVSKESETSVALSAHEKVKVYEEWVDTDKCPESICSTEAEIWYFYPLNPFRGDSTTVLSNMFYRALDYYCLKRGIEYTIEHNVWADWLGRSYAKITVDNISDNVKGIEEIARMHRNHK